MDLTSGLPPAVSEELTRLARRWQQLPLRQAFPYAARLRELAQHLFDLVAARTGGRPGEVSDLGPATALDQLRVAVHDAAALADPALDVEVTEALARLRRGIPG